MTRLDQWVDRVEDWLECWRPIPTALALAVFVLLLVHVLPADAQQLDPLAPVQAYTTADPNNPDRLGLATPDGRFSITPIQGCEWVVAGEDVTTYPNWNLPPWLSIGQDGEHDCVVRVEGRMDATPCFTNDAGVCDVATEFDAN
jgi:hypothetical protein